MLGNYSQGMSVRIPARFQDNNKNPVEVDNVTVRIEHFDRSLNQVIHDLSATSMNKVAPSTYIYDFKIPPNMPEGTYTVYISAKQPNNPTRVFEALENFLVVAKKVQDIVPEEENIEKVEPPKINYLFDQNKPTFQNDGELKTVEDLVVDVYNNPIAGVHVNIYDKLNFIPNDQNNVKVYSTITDNNGKWSAKLPRGEYVVSYKAIAFKEVREFRRV